MLTRFSLLIFVLFTSAKVFAVDAHPLVTACDDKQASRTDYSRCLDTQVQRIEREMSMWVNNQRFILEDLKANSGRGSALAMFDRAQDQFMQYRETNCRWYYLKLAPKRDAGLSYKKCLITVSQQRIDELKISTQQEQ